MDSLASFVQAGHIAGPISLENLPYDPNNLKLISLFGKPRPHGGKLRLINDLSSPKGRSFNDGIPLSVLNDINMEVAQIQHVVRTLLLCGKGARLSKHDLAEAFQILAVHPSQWEKQAIKIFNSSYFLCLKMCYGDRQAAHRFSRFHEVLIWNLTAPNCQIPGRQLHMCIDDLIAITPGFLADTHLKEFDEEYSSVVKGLQLSEKPPDPSGLKAFVNLPVGELLGFLVDADNHTWSLSDEKFNKIIDSIDSVCHIKDVTAPVPVTLKAAQKVAGKLQALSAIHPDINIWLPFIVMDITKYVKKFPEENTNDFQQRNFYFSTQAKQDLRFVRAFLIATRGSWIPLSNPEQYVPIQPGVLIHCDASGAVNTPPDQPGPSLGIYIPEQNGAIPRAVSFVLPLPFLRAEDDKNANYHHTTLLEGKFPPT